MSAYNNFDRSFKLETDKGYYFTATLDSGFSSQKNYDGLTDSERIVKTTLTLKANGYLIKPDASGLLPQIKRYVSSPYIAFEIVVAAVPKNKKTTNLASSNPKDYTDNDLLHENDLLPGSQIHGAVQKFKQKDDILIGKFGKMINPELIIEDIDKSSGKKSSKQYVIKDRNYRKGETVLREVKVLS